MKIVILIILIPYLLIIGGVFYLYFGPGVITGYKALHWKDIETMVPADAKEYIYNSKGWEVYSLRKASVFIKIALKPAMNVAGLPSYSPKILYKESAGPDEIYYISNPHKTIEIVYARTIGDMTVYFSVASPSLFSGLFIMDKMTAQCFYKGERVTSLTSSDYSIPSRCYLTDYIFVGTIVIPFILLLVIFGLSGKKPSEKHFMGEPIRCEESYIYYTNIRRFRRKGGYCYLALTADRLRMFLFMRPTWSIDIHEAKSLLKIAGNTIILQKEKERITFRSAKIRQWQEALGLTPYY